VWSYDRRPLGQVNTARLNADAAGLAADHVIVPGVAEDLYEQVLVFWDRVGAAYAAAHESVASHVGDYRARLASGHGCLDRAASAHVDFVKAVAATRADLCREITTASASAWRNIVGSVRTRV
jgi:hypothetical protein